MRVVALTFSQLPVYLDQAKYIKWKSVLYFLINIFHRSLGCLCSSSIVVFIVFLSLSAFSKKSCLRRKVIQVCKVGMLSLNSRAIV